MGLKGKCHRDFDLSVKMVWCNNTNYNTDRKNLITAAKETILMSLIEVSLTE